MPPVGIIVGTTLATAAVVIGTGYVLKKYVYDPHLSHHVEAFLATHPAFARSQAQHDPIAVPLSSDHSQSSGSTTAYQDHHTGLRRRRGGARWRKDESELQETAWLGSSIGASAYELSESRQDLLAKAVSGSPALGGPSPAMPPLVDLSEGRPESPQDAEVREVIFRLAPTPLRSSTPTLDRIRPAESAPVESPVNPFMDPPPLRHLSSFSNRPTTSLHPPAPSSAGIPSTTFSFLSLSQESSPEPLHHRSLAPLSFSSALERELSGASALAGEDDTDRDDILSLPETSTTGFEDAESYTPISRAMSPATRSPHPVDNSAASADPPVGLPPVCLEVGSIGDLGLNYIPVVPSIRGPMSVISMGGSDLGDSEGEWDLVSDSGR